LDFCAVYPEKRITPKKNAKRQIATSMTAWSELQKPLKRQKTYKRKNTRSAARVLASRQVNKLKPGMPNGYTSGFY